LLRMCILSKKFVNASVLMTIYILVNAI